MGARKEMPFKPKHHISPELVECEAAEGRADDARDVELNGLQRDGIGHVLFIDQHGNQGLIGGAAEGLGEARK